MVTVDATCHLKYSRGGLDEEVSSNGSCCQDKFNFRNEFCHNIRIISTFSCQTTITTAQQLGFLTMKLDYRLDFLTPPKFPTLRSDSWLKSRNFFDICMS